MRATCFFLYLGHPQACQYRNLTKEDIIKRSLVYDHYFYHVKTMNTKCKSIRPNKFYKLKYIKTFIRFRSSCVEVRVCFTFRLVYFNSRSTCQGQCSYCVWGHCHLCAPERRSSIIMHSFVSRHIISLLVRCIQMISLWLHKD